MILPHYEYPELCCSSQQIVVQDNIYESAFLNVLFLSSGLWGNCEDEDFKKMGNRHLSEHLLSNPGKPFKNQPLDKVRQFFKKERGLELELSERDTTEIDVPNNCMKGDTTHHYTSGFNKDVEISFPWNELRKLREFVEKVQLAIRRVNENNSKRKKRTLPAFLVKDIKILKHTLGLRIKVLLKNLRLDKRDEERALKNKLKAHQKHRSCEKIKSWENEFKILSAPPVENLDQPKVNQINPVYCPTQFLSQNYPSINCYEQSSSKIATDCTQNLFTIKTNEDQCYYKASSRIVEEEHGHFNFSTVSLESKTAKTSEPEFLKISKASEHIQGDILLDDSLIFIKPSNAQIALPSLKDKWMKMLDEQEDFGTDISFESKTKVVPAINPDLFKPTKMAGAGSRLMRISSASENMQVDTIAGESVVSIKSPSPNVQIELPSFKAQVLKHLEEQGHLEPKIALDLKSADPNLLQPTKTEAYAFLKISSDSGNTLNDTISQDSWIFIKPPDKQIALSSLKLTALNQIEDQEHLETIIAPKHLEPTKTAEFAFPKISNDCENTLDDALLDDSWIFVKPPDTQTALSSLKSTIWNHIEEQGHLEKVIAPELLQLTETEISNDSENTQDDDLLDDSLILVKPSVAQIDLSNLKSTPGNHIKEQGNLESVIAPELQHTKTAGSAFLKISNDCENTQDDVLLDDSLILVEPSVAQIDLSSLKSTPAILIEKQGNLGTISAPELQPMKTAGSAFLKISNDCEKIQDDVLLDDSLIFVKPPIAQRALPSLKIRARKHLEDSNISFEEATVFISTSGVELRTVGDLRRVFLRSAVDRVSNEVFNSISNQEQQTIVV